MRLELVDPYTPRARELWRALAEATPPSYFLSPGWIETWLATLPRHRAPDLAVLDGGTRAGFLGKRLAMHRGVVPSRTYYLNATGTRKFDNLWIEYNGLVGGDAPLDELLAALPGGWDEVVLPGMAADSLGALATRYPLVRREVPSYTVQLDQVRASAKGYLALLSGQTRSQIRRAQREAGELTVTLARNEAEAVDIYSELAALHIVQWRAKGEPGAFADPWFDRFHRTLITRRFRHGEIQLVRVRNTTGTVGCLYNFVWQGRVLQYQSGLALYDDPHQKPGFVCHTAAIEHAAHAGLGVYDFLGGEMRYKKSLSTSHEALVWATVQRPRLRFAVEERVVAAVKARRLAAESTPESVT